MLGIKTPTVIISLALPCGQSDNILLISGTKFTHTRITTLARARYWDDPMDRRTRDRWWIVSFACDYNKSYQLLCEKERTVVTSRAVNTCCGLTLENLQALHKTT